MQRACANMLESQNAAVYTAVLPIREISINMKSIYPGLQWGDKRLLARVQSMAIRYNLCWQQQHHQQRRKRHRKIRRKNATTWIHQIKWLVNSQKTSESWFYTPSPVDFPFFFFLFFLFIVAVLSSHNSTPTLAINLWGKNNVVLLTRRLSGKLVSFPSFLSLVS